MNGDTGTEERPTKRAKVDVACETCRQRKTRCDGNKPICSLCENLSLNCVYRKPVEGGRNEDILKRLTNAEARLQALESGPPHSDGLGHSQNDTSRIAQVPHLHTAGAHKILHCWPRLRVKYTHPTIEPLRYLFTANQQDFSLLGLVPSPLQSISSNVLYALIEALQDHSAGIPSTVATLLQCTELFSTQGLTCDPMFWHNGRFELGSLPPNLLLLLVVAVGFLHPAAQQGDHFPEAQGMFASILQDSWKLYDKGPEEQIPTFLMIAYLQTYLFSHPFHATGILRYVGSLLNLPFMRYGSSNSAYEARYRMLTTASEHNEKACTYCRLHFLLESDIYSEIGGFPSTPDKLLVPAVLYCHGGEDTTVKLLDFHMRLRVLENDILSGLYGPSKAYVHPDQIGQTISRISRDLEDWYRGLPLDMQFSRNTLHQSDDEQQNWRLIELAQRYLKCEFLLNRPVFYFVLHEDMEQSASPPEVMATHQGIRPWMRDACYATIRSAIAILGLRAIPRQHNNWCDNQLLLAAYLMTLQARLKPKLSGLKRQFRDSDINTLLDSAEHMLETEPEEALVDRWTLEIMRNVRRNVAFSLENQSSPT